MTTPATFNTPYKTICDALRDAQLLGLGQQPNSEQLAEGINRLNQLINLKQAKGLKLWTNFDLSVTLTQGVNLYTFGPTGTVVMTKPLRVPFAYFLDTSNNRRPILPLSRQEWTNLSNLTNQGQVTQFFVDKQQNTLNVYFWLTPDATAATGTAHLIIQQQLTNMVGLNDALSFPVEWYQYLHWALASQVCSASSQEIKQWCKMNEKENEEILEGWDVEDAQTFFTPDQQLTMNERMNFE